LFKKSKANTIGSNVFKQLKLYLVFALEEQAIMVRAGPTQPSHSWNQKLSLEQVHCLCHELSL